LGAIVASGSGGWGVVEGRQSAGGSQARSAGLPGISTLVSGFQKLDGFVPMYWDGAHGTLYLEIPKLDTEMLYVSVIAAGMGSNDIGIDRAQPGAERIVSFQRVGQKILMVQPNYDY